MWGDGGHPGWTAGVGPRPRPGLQAQGNGKRAFLGLSRWKSRRISLQDQTKGGQGPRPWKRGCRMGLKPAFRGDWGTDRGGSALGLLVLFFSQVTASPIAYCLYT